MEYRLRRIGWVKAIIFNNNFDDVYDFWKNKAFQEHKYNGDLKFIKEKSKVYIYIVLPNIDEYYNNSDDIIDIFT